MTQNQTRRTITTVEELEALPLYSVVASISFTSNVSTILVWQRGSLEGLGFSDWCTPNIVGCISSADVFRFLRINEMPAELVVLVDRSEQHPPPRPRSTTVSP
jgi:hypothetical protein